VKIIKRISKVILKIFVVIFLVFSILPYAMGSITGEEPSTELYYENSKFESIQGVRVHYREWFPQDTTKGHVLLVHGLGGSSFSWRETVEDLVSEGYVVIAIDLPGFGLSDKTGDFDHNQKNRATIVWTLLNIFDDDIEWNLVGHSMGGGTVAAMTVTNPERVSNLVLVNGALFTDNNRLSSFVLSFPPAKKWAELVLNRIYFEEDRVSKILKSAYGREPSNFEVEGYMIPLRLEGTVTSLLNMVKTSRSITEDEFIKIDIPISAIWGANDTWVSVERMYDYKRLNDSLRTYVIGEAGHCPMETHANQFNIMLLEAIK
jgi:pimeloyl-ACP methyl ester carboxylesterase